MSTVFLEPAALFEPAARTHVRRSLRYCDSCGRLSSQQEACCRRCASDSMTTMSPFGEIYSYTTVHGDNESFVLALVQLSGGTMLTAKIVDAQHEIRIGLPVEFAAEMSLESESGGLFFAPLAAK